MSTDFEEYRNPWGWPLNETDAIIGVSEYEPLDDPAASIAERLIYLGHSTFNPDVWSSRRATYWEAYTARIEGAVNVVDVASWWVNLMQSMSGRPLPMGAKLHEKNLLIYPKQLHPFPVEDSEVLAILRSYTPALIDRVRMSLHIQRELNEELKEGSRA